MTGTQLSTQRVPNTQNSRFADLCTRVLDGIIKHSK
jgi:hypothetical protein